MSKQGPLLGETILVRPSGPPRGLTPGIKLRLEIDQIIDRRPGPHRAGRAEVLEDGRLALSFVDTEAGRTARALVADDILDVVLWGPRPTVRLRVNSS